MFGGPDGNGGGGVWEGLVWFEEEGMRGWLGWSDGSWGGDEVHEGLSFSGGRVCEESHGHGHWTTDGAMG